MTSNIGARQIIDQKKALGFSADEEKATADYNTMRENVMGELKKAFRPEFLNRIDEIVMFGQLGKSCINKIVQIQLERVFARLKDRKITLHFDDSAMNFLADVGYEPSMGARPVKRAIQTYVENPLAKELLSGNISEGSDVDVTFVQDKSAQQEPENQTEENLAGKLEFKPHL